MPSERVQRQIDRLLDQAEAAIELADWNTVVQRSRGVLRLDPENQDAMSYLEAAQRDSDSGISEQPAAPSASGDPIPSTSEPVNEQPSSFADGRYVVQRFLGEGGKKKVYLAHD